MATANNVDRSQSSAAFASVSLSASGGDVISDVTRVDSDMVIARIYFSLPVGCTYILLARIDGAEHILASGTTTATNYTFSVGAGVPIPANSTVEFLTGATVGAKRYTALYRWE